MNDIKLQTVVPPVCEGLHCSYDDKYLLVGSCFSDAVGQKMLHMGMSAMVNPLGVLYNPLSIAESLTRCIEQRCIAESDLVFYEGVWHSWLHHSSFSRPDKDACIEACNTAMMLVREALLGGSTLIVTFGTAYVFERVADGRVVGNCHKVAAANFNRRLVPVAEIVSVWEPLLKDLEKYGTRVVFTVSPIRHLADGAHGNQLSKSTLLLAVEALSAIAPIHYFPAYEIVLDELRDYRFYERDMIHPSELAVDIVWSHFQESYMSQDDIEKCNEGLRQFKRSAHRKLMNY